jgi:hypothetical protein
MSEWLLFRADHPVTLRMARNPADQVAWTGRLHTITRSEISVVLHQMPQKGDGLRVGDDVVVEAADYHGLHLSVFRGVVASIETRLVEIKRTGEMQQVQRRASPRARTPRRFATAILDQTDARRYFLVNPVDIGRGGVRLRHRLSLSPGDRFQLLLRLGRDAVITPTASVIESWEHDSQAHNGVKPLRTFVSRASFVELSDHDEHMIDRYVSLLLQNTA